MNPTRRRQPNLEDVLARDFAELGAGEAPPEPTNEDGPAVPENKEAETMPVQPIVYNQRIDALEERTAFVVKPPSSPAKDEQQSANSSASISSHPVASLGDDFDVDW